MGTLSLYIRPSDRLQRYLSSHLRVCLCFLLRRHRSLLHPERRRASAIGRAGLRNPSPSRSCTGRGRIRFLGSASRDCSRTSPFLFDYVRHRRTTTPFVVVRLHHIIIEVHLQKDSMSTSASKLYVHTDLILCLYLLVIVLL